MIKHIILWKLKDEFSPEEKNIIKKNAKAGLEGLAGRLEGIITMKVITEPIASSTCDMMLYSEFEDEAALMSYKAHPEHLAVANTHIRPNVQVRLCMDHCV